MVKSKQTTYEEVRQQRLAENKKRMEDLNLTTLAQAISPMKSGKPRTPRKQIIVTQVRRSPRVANSPTPVYKQELVDIIQRPSRRRIFLGRHYSLSRDLSSRVYAPDEVRVNAIERAEELDTKLENGFPTFVKPMLKSHVTGGFWLGLPNHFCRDNLPSRDETITLVDEKGEEWPTVYIAHRTGLSGGWRGFAIDHELVDGDALVFELTQPTQFKVHIVKATDY